MTTTDSYHAIIGSNADEAYERVLPEALALGGDALLPINVDLSSALVTAMGIVAKVPQLESDLRHLHGFPMDAVERFPDYVLALLSAQSRYAFAVSPPKQDPALLAAGAKWRAILIADVEALMVRNLLDSSCLGGLTRTHGYKNVAFDLSGLARLMKTAWPTIEGQTGLKAAEVAEVDKLALRLMAVVARREHSPEAIAEATTIRQRMYTLFHTAYDALRRAATYLRWNHDDVDDFVPSIFAGRGNGKPARKRDTNASARVGAGRPTEAEADQQPSLGSEHASLGSEHAAQGPKVAGAPGAAGDGSSSAVPVGMPGASRYWVS